MVKRMKFLFAAALTLLHAAASAQNWPAKAMRLLAVTSPQRLPNCPDIPAAAETLRGFQVIGWVAGFAEFLKSERERWGKIARDAGGQPQ